MQLFIWHCRKMVADSPALFYCINISGCLSWNLDIRRFAQSVHEVNVLVYAQRTILTQTYIQSLELFEQQTVLSLIFLFHFSSSFTLQLLSWLYSFDATEVMMCMHLLSLILAQFLVSLFNWDIVSFNFKMLFVSLRNAFLLRYWKSYVAQLVVCHAAKAYCSEHVHIFKKRRKRKETAKFTICRRFVMGIWWLCARICVC